MKNNLSDNALEVLKRRYFVKDDNGKVIENWEQLCQRVSDAVISDEKGRIHPDVATELCDRYYEMIHSLYFLPNTPTLVNAGRENQEGWLACYVYPIEDNMQSIMKTATDAAMTHKGGGGTGFSFSKLRASGSQVKTTSGVASGPVSFMKMYNDITEQIKQGGVRRGANMGLLHCLAGRNKVNTINGKIPISELAGKEAYIYSYDSESKEVKIKRAIFYKNGENKKIYAVKLDNDDIIYATNNHEFMLSDGSYKKLSELAINDSLMAFYKSSNNKYTQVGVTNQTFSKAEHILVGEYIIGRKLKTLTNNKKRGPLDEVAHHIDGNTFNNNPDNILVMSISEHAKIHSKVLRDNQERTSKRRKGKKLSEICSAEVVEKWKLNMSKAAKNKKNKVWNYGIDSNEYKSRYKNGFKNQFSNHRVKEIFFVGEEDVYDATVPDLHNFAVENIFVHNCTHPDLLSFVDCKQDTSQITNFNISVAVTNEFMKAVEKDEEYSLIDPRTKKEVKKLKARTVFQKICKNAWHTGEPGLFFIDEANNNDYSRLRPENYIEATNPCVSGDTKIATLNGNIAIKELAENKEDILVYCWDKSTKLPTIKCMRNIRKTRENVNIVKVTFDSGLSVKCTPDHNFFSFRGEKVKAEDLRIGQRVRAFGMSKHPDGHIRMHGWVNNKTNHVWVHRVLYELYNGAIPDDLVINHKDGNPSNNSIKNLEILTVYEHNSHHYPERFKNGFSAKGTERTPEQRKKISESLKKYYSLNHKVISVESCGIEDVYNGVVDDCHTYIIADDKYAGTYKDGLLSGVVSANCGEVPLRAYEACTLGSLNLTKFYSKTLNRIDYQVLGEYIELAVRFLDSVIEMSPYPIPEVKTTHMQTRKIGLGVMGWADLLIQMKIPYGSKKSIELANEVMGFIHKCSKSASEKIGKEKGISEACAELMMSQRNLWTTIIAPTGTISIIADASSGVEPLFSVAYIRTCMDDTKLIVVSPLFEKAMKDAGIEITDKLKETLLSSMSIQSIKEIPEDIRKIFVTAADLEPKQHVEMQATFQKYVDGAVSKTVNMPEKSTISDVEEVFMIAWKSKCKGATVYRDGSRPNQVLSSKKKEEKSKEKNRKTVTDGTTEKVKIPSFGTLYFIVNKNDDESEPIETFLQIGKSGGDINAFNETIGRLISMLLRHNVSPKEIGKQLKGIKGEEYFIHNNTKYLSIPDFIGRRLIEYSKEKAIEDREEAVLAICPECEGRLYRSENCYKCMGCGWSKC